MFNFQPGLNIRIYGPETKSQKVGSKHCTICDIWCVQFVAKGPSPYLLHQKRGAMFCTCYTKNYCWNQVDCFLFVWEFVSAWK